MAVKQESMTPRIVDGIVEPSSHTNQPNRDDEVRMLTQMLKEERAKNHQLSQQYEKHLCHIRAENVTKIAQARAAVLAEVDDTIKRYHRLALEAIKAGKAATYEAEQNEKRGKELAEKACAKFEQDCKTKMREVLDGYRYLADKATQQAEADTRQLKATYEELLQEHANVKKEFERQLVQATEAQLAPYRAEVMKLESANRSLRMEAEHTFTDIRDEVARNFERFEALLISQCLALLWQHNIPITELELRERLSEALDQGVQPPAPPE